MKKWLLVIGGGLACLIVMAAGGGYWWFQHTLKKSLPQVSGELSIPGIKDTVQILRDSYGVPHIYAKNEPDLYFALGYAMAQDRLWQMDFSRRLGQGRLSEIFGEDFVKVDRYFRMLTAAGVNTEIPAEFAVTLQSFTNGLNVYLKTHKDRLPIEFKLLRYEPEPWQVDDYISIVKVITWALSVGWNTDLTAGTILKWVGDPMFKEAFPSWPGHAPLIIPEKTIALSSIPDLSIEAARIIERLIPLHSAGASNNWVVAGKKSVSGKPMLANDAHLPLTNPSFWWEVHLICPTIDASGF
ncbi:MAG: penicillin acylase family protein, partial [Proteobacteria bacterium]|nr:penicillin acylase family protein [Pseudomonadota bacterium]